MKKQTSIIFLVCFLLASCASPLTTTTPPSSSEPPIQISTSTEIVLEPTATPECAVDEVRDIADSIASSYTFTTSQEVLTWFCDGAAFEDIITALETQDASGESAGDLLELRADGLSWDEIWQVIGLYGD